MAAPEQPDESVVSESARTDEEVRVHAWAELRFLDMGYAPADALELADGRVDWHRAQALIARGCSLALASRLLLPL